jgi:hypothetical protein
MHFSLEENLSRLGFLFAAERATLRRLGGWLAGIPYWDAKLAVGAHIWEDAQHAEALLKRLHELKDLGAERRVSLPIEQVLDRAAATPNVDEFLAGIYRCLKPWLLARYVEHLRGTDPVMDAPTVEILERIVREKQQQIAWFTSYRPQFSPVIDPARTRGWERTITTALAALAEGEQSANGESAELAPASFSVFLTPQRDACFRTAYKREWLMNPTTFEEHRLSVFWNHTQEMQFAESLGETLYESAEMPWAFHFDLARHLADEIRHTRMGCTRLEQLGVPLTKYPMLLQNYSMRARLDPMSRFCMMTLVIEAASFEGKRKNVEIFNTAGDEISARYETYDIRDEMMHVNFGHVWVPIMLKIYHDNRSVPELVQQCRDLRDAANRGAVVAAASGYSRAMDPIVRSIQLAPVP